MKGRWLLKPVEMLACIPGLVVYLAQRWSLQQSMKEN